MNRTQKHEFVADVREAVERAELIVVAGYSGLTVSQLTDLRVRVRSVGGYLKVVKNRLAQRAVESTRASVVGPLFKGPVLIACSDDVEGLPKLLKSFSKAHDSLVVLGGAMGRNFLSSEAISALAELPSLDELRGRIIGVIATPAMRIAGVLQAPAGQLARVTSARARQGEAA